MARPLPWLSTGWARRPSIIPAWVLSTSAATTIRARGYPDWRRRLGTLGRLLLGHRRHRRLHLAGGGVDSRHAAHATGELGDFHRPREITHGRRLRVLQSRFSHGHG